NEVPTRAATSSMAPSGNAMRSAPAIRSENVVEAVQDVTHSLPLGPQVGDVLRIGGQLQRDALGDVQAEAFETAVLGRVVRHDAHGGHAEIDQHLRPDAVLTAVHRQTLLQVRIDGVVTFLLELVGADLVTQPDATPFVTPQVDQHAATLLFDPIE